MAKNQNDYSSRFFNKHSLKLITRLLLAALTYNLLLSPTGALALEEVKNTGDNATVAQETTVIDEQENDTPEPIKEEFITTPLGVKGISAYNVGDPGQTDSSPCTAANGENICLALELGYKRCASNIVPFGTILEIEGYGRCLVTDRMNSRYTNHVDIAMKKTEKKEALKFGRKKLKVHILKKIESI